MSWRRADRPRRPALGRARLRSARAPGALLACADFLLSSGASGRGWSRTRPRRRPDRGPVGFALIGKMAALFALVFVAIGSPTWTRHPVRARLLGVRGVDHAASGCSATDERRRERPDGTARDLVRLPPRLPRRCATSLRRHRSAGPGPGRCSRRRTSSSTTSWARSSCSRSWRSARAATPPPSAARATRGWCRRPKFGLRNLFEVLADTVFGLMAGVMGEKDARALPPLVGTLFFFILFSNLLGADPRLPAADRHAEDQPGAVGPGVPAERTSSACASTAQVLQALPRPDLVADPADAADRAHQPHRAARVALHAAPRQHRRRPRRRAGVLRHLPAASRPCPSW